MKESRQWNVITIDKLNSLTDKEILIFDKVLRHKHMWEISVEMGMDRKSVSALIVRVCYKLEVLPKKANFLRMAWRNSLAIEKARGRTLRHGDYY